MHNKNHSVYLATQLTRLERRRDCLIEPNRRQSGAIGMTTALVLGMAVLFAALSIDTGRVYLEQRSLQRIADLAALDAATASGICGAGAPEAAQESAVRNGYQGDLLTDTDNTDGVFLGSTNSKAAGVRAFVPEDNEAATAIRVASSNTIPQSLVLPGILGDDVTLGAAAVAGSQVVAGISVGSGLASIDTEQSVILNALLGQVLGSSISLDAVSYNGIADTQITIRDLVNASASAGTVDELLTAESSVGELLELYAEAVSQSNAVDASVEAALQELISANVSDVAVRLADVINVTTSDPEAAAAANLNLLDLITTTALVANGTNAASVNIQIPGLLGAQLKVIELPQIAVGPPGLKANGDPKTQAHTSQIELIAPIGGPIPAPLKNFITLDLGLKITVAQGSAWLDKITCPNLGGTDADVWVQAKPGILNIAVTNRNGTGPGNIDVHVGVLHVLSLTPQLEFPGEEPDFQALPPFQFDLTDPNSLPPPQSVNCTLADCLENGFSELGNRLTLVPKDEGIVNILLNNVLRSLHLSTLDELIGEILGQAIAPLINTLAANLLDPLLGMLGVNVGIADVEVFSLSESQPNLLI